MKILSRYFPSFLLIGLPFLMAAEDLKRVDWELQPSLGNTKASPRVMPGMSVNQWFWAEWQGGELVAHVFQPETGQENLIRMREPSISKVVVLSHALKANDFGVVSGVIHSVEGKMLSGFIVVDLKQGSFRVVDTGRYFPRQPSVDGNGHVWTLGWERNDSLTETTDDFHVLRAYDRSGKQVWSGLPKSQIGVPMVEGMISRSRTFAHGSRVVAYLSKANILVESSIQSEAATLNSGPPISSRARTIGVAQCDGRSTFLVAMDNEHSYPYVRVSNGSWQKIGFYRDGEHKSFWAPQLPYCAENGNPMAIVGFDHLGTLTMR